MPVDITVCITCRSGSETISGTAGRAGGEILAQALEEGADGRGLRLRIRRHECLWACRDSCTVLVQERGKTGYLAGRFEAGATAAGAILDWARLYGESPDGTVRYALWPEGIKGHFIARIPADGEADP